jgi:hypothetical protein
MKTMILNPTRKGGLLIRKSENAFNHEFSIQTLNWWINNEVPFYISIGYKIDVRTQVYDATNKTFK